MKLPQHHVCLKEETRGPKAANPTLLLQRGPYFYYFYALTKPRKQPWPHHSFEIEKTEGDDATQVLLDDPEAVYDETTLFRVMNPQDDLDPHLWGTPDPMATRIVAATILGNQLTDGKVWPILVGPPSCGKTHTVGLFKSLELSNIVHYADQFTPAAIWSAKAFDESLLTQVCQGGTLILSDASTLYSRGIKNFMRIMEILRRVYDGSFEDHTVYGKRRWTGRIGLLVCATPVIHKQRKLGQTFGDRFIYYSLRPQYCPMLSTVDLGALVSRTIEEKCVLEDGTLLKVGDYPCTVEDDLLAISDLTEIFRTAIPIRFRSFNETVFKPAESHRVRLQYRTLAVAMAILEGRAAVGRHTARSIMKICIQSALPRYADIVYAVYGEKVKSVDIIRQNYQLSHRIFDAAMADLIAFDALHLGDNGTIWPGDRFQRLYDTY